MLQNAENKIDYQPQRKRVRTENRPVNKSVNREVSKKVRQKSHKRKSAKRIFLVFWLTVGTAFLLVLYCLVGMRYEAIYLPNTIIDGVDASNQSIEEFRQSALEKISSYTLVLEERDNQTEQITGKEIGLRAEFGEELETILQNQNPYAWIFLIGQEKTYQTFAAITLEESMLDKAINRLKCMTSDRQTKSVDAHISDYVAGAGYSIVPEEVGTEVQKGKLKEAIKEAVKNLEGTISLEKAGCYKEPVIYESDEHLANMVTKMNQYVDMSVTYQFGEKTEVLDGERICEWMVIGKDNTMSFDEEKIKEYVKELASTYDTIYTSRTFKTSYGSEVCVYRGDYGWKMNQEEEAEALKEILLSGESQIREPIYTQKAASHGANDYGDSYLEINLTAQHLWLYQNGVIVLESDFVSGNLEKGYGTPEGIYPITYKERNATLKGEGYETPVSYWMPFNKGIGLHDSSWRTTYGGTIYKTGGSHGCINLPPENARIIYETVKQGEAVICYELEGTERSGITDLAPPQEPKETTESVATAEEG